MSKYNNVIKTPKQFSYEGAVIYKSNPVEAWMNFVMSSYLENTFYEESKEQFTRFINLTLEIADAYGWEFVGKVAYFARNFLGMRSVSHVLAATLNSQNFQDKRAFFRNFFRRPDDVAEVFALVDKSGGKLSHALMRGSADYLSKLSDYTLGKYKLTKHNYNMYDLINITHAHSQAIDKYKNDILENPDTWEVAISTADAMTKNKEWIRLVEEKKLGYLALIRNLNNILNAVNELGLGYSWIEDYLYTAITNNIAINKSLVLPYQIYTAYKNLKYQNTVLTLALEHAFKISTENIPDFPGISTILLDVSGSMHSPISKDSDISILEAGAVFSTALYLKSNAYVVKFGSDAKVVKFSKLDTPFKIISEMCENDNCGYGTYIQSGFKAIKWPSNRIFIISDEQTMTSPAWRTNITGEDCYKQYCHDFGECYCYSYNLGNYNSQIINPNNPHVYLLTSLSTKIMEYYSMIEQDSFDIIDYINRNYSYSH